MKRKSILFVRPDYHCSFFYRDELRRLGWKADVYVPPEYPENLLYSNNDILRAPHIGNKKFLVVRLLNTIVLFLWWLTIFWRYKFHFYYGRPPAFDFKEKKLKLNKLLGENFLLELWFAKLFGAKFIYIPTGCHDTETKANYLKLDNGKVCGNCGTFNKCNDEKNLLNFSIVKRYYDLVIGMPSVESTQLRRSAFAKYKAIDLDLWHPEIKIPDEHLLPKTNNLLILHSAYVKKSGRNWDGRNIKGSPYVLEAIERLRSEGHNVKYFFISNKLSNQMRFYQAQADIIVDQLIYGSWGSTGLEAMALGKPVVCYLRPTWKAFFLKMFPKVKDLPIVEADTDTIYNVLKKLVTVPSFRARKSLESRRFAEELYDVKKNTKELMNILQTL